MRWFLCAMLCLHRWRKMHGAVRFGWASVQLMMQFVILPLMFHCIEVMILRLVQLLLGLHRLCFLEQVLLAREPEIPSDHESETELSSDGVKDPIPSLDLATLAHAPTSQRIHMRQVFVPTVDNKEIIVVLSSDDEDDGGGNC